MMTEKATTTSVLTVVFPGELELAGSLCVSSWKTAFRDECYRRCIVSLTRPTV